MYLARGLIILVLLVGLLSTCDLLETEDTPLNLSGVWRGELTEFPTDSTSLFHRITLFVEDEDGKLDVAMARSVRETNDSYSYLGEGKRTEEGEVTLTLYGAPTSEKFSATVLNNTRMRLIWRPKGDSLSVVLRKY